MAELQMSKDPFCLLSLSADVIVTVPCYCEVEHFCIKGMVWIQLRKIQYLNANLTRLRFQIGEENSVTKTHQHVFSLSSNTELL